MRMKSWLVVVVAGCLAGGLPAGAQDLRPSVAPFPLEIKRSAKNFSERQRKELARELRRVLSASAQLPDSATLDSALAKLDGERCERDDDCLARLAHLAGCLYGLYVSVDLSLDEKQVVATGRVVRDDGQLIGPLERVEIPKGGRDSFEDLAKQAITRVAERLVVAQRLPPSKPGPVVEAVKAVEEPKPGDPKLPPPPPPPPLLVVESRPNVGRIAGWGAVGVGAAVGIVGVATFATAPLIRRDADGNIFREDVSRTAATQSQQGVGVGLMVGGLGAAAVGAVMVALSKDADAVKASVVPMTGGAMVFAGGTF